MIREMAESAMRLMRKHEQCEAYAVRSVVNAVYMDGSRIGNVETKTDIGLSVRLSDGRRQGRSSVTFSDDTDIKACVETAFRISRLSPEGGDPKGYPVPAAKGDGRAYTDPRIENIRPEDLMDISRAILDSCDTEIPRGLLRVSTVESVLMNGNGVFTEHRGTMLYGHFTSMARLEHPGEGTETCFGTRFSLDPEAIGASLSEKARTAASARPFRGRRRLTMILPPSELGDMLMSSAGSALNGENVLYGRSLWKDMEGGTVASDTVTLTDDPASGAPLCSAFDDEGTPAGRKVMVEKGILRSYMRDSFVGGSTGNGMRRSAVESQGIYENPVSIKPMNLVLSPGRESPDDIISQTKDGILVEKFAWPEADPLTGRFGLEVRSGRMVRDGRIEGTINGALLMGNMVSALRNVELIGNDPRNMGCVTVPTVSFAGIELIGN